MYPQEMSRMHLFDEIKDNKYTPEDFGLIANVFDYNTGNTYQLLQLNKLLKIYELSTGKDYLLNGDNSHKFYVFINKYQNKNFVEIDLDRDRDASKWRIVEKDDKKFEGEIIGYLGFNPADFNRRMQYNCRLCIDYFLNLFTNFPKSVVYDISIATASERSELVSFTRAHYYQLVKVFPSLSRTFSRVSGLIDIEKRASPDLYKKVFDIYRKDLD
jgi:hypothetical protein